MYTKSNLDILSKKENKDISKTNCAKQNIFFKMKPPNNGPVRKQKFANKAIF